MRSRSSWIWEAYATKRPHMHRCTRTSTTDRFEWEEIINSSRVCNIVAINFIRSQHNSEHVFAPCGYHITHLSTLIPCSMYSGPASGLDDVPEAGACGQCKAWRQRGECINVSKMHFCNDQRVHFMCQRNVVHTSWIWIDNHVKNMVVACRRDYWQRETRCNKLLYKCTLNRVI